MRVFICATALLLCILHATNAQSVYELCAGCSMVNGAGYNRHLTDCDKFVHCYYDANGVLHGEIQQCAFSTYWSSSVLTCIPAEKIVCPNDKCEGQTNGTTFGAEGNCRGYWECEAGKAQAKCCPEGQNWNDTLAACVDNIDDDQCTDKCFNEAENKTCDLRAVPGEPGFYQQQVHGLFWVRMRCATGTVFVEDECACGMIVDPVIPVKPVCQRELYLPFTKNHFDESGKGHYVENENVEVVDGVARFNGVNSRLIVPRFTNLDHSTSVVIRVKYTSDHVTSPEQHAIVSNSDCGNVPSILISEDAFSTRYGVGTSYNFFSVTVPQTELPVNETVSVKDLVYMFDGGVLAGSNGVTTNSVQAPGYLKNVQCGLHIGDADNLLSFEGEIDEVEVFLCNPF